MLLQEFVDGLSSAGEFRVIIIVADDNSLRDEARLNESESSALGFVKIAVEKGKSNIFRQILRSEVGKPSFFDDDVSETMFFEFVNESMARDVEHAGLKIDSGGGFVLGGFGGKAFETVVGIETLLGLLQNLCQLDRGVAAVTAKFHKIPVELGAGLGQLEDFGGFGGSDLVVHPAEFTRSATWLF